MANANYTTSTYFISLTNNGAGGFTPTVIRNGVAPSGGTTVSIPFVENNGNTGSAYPATYTLLPGVAIQAALRAVVNDISNGN
jgi:hypothetical protein